MANYNAIRGRLVQSLSSDPSITSAYEGQVWYNSTSSLLKSVAHIKATSSGANLPTTFYYPGGVGPTTATLGTVSVVANAVVEIASVVLSSFFSTNYIYTAVSAEDYNKDRTVYVDFRDNFINNVVIIEEEDRTIYIPEKQHNVRSKTLLAA